MQPAGFFTETLRLQALRNGSGEGNDVVLYFGFNLVDALCRGVDFLAIASAADWGMTPSSASTALAADSTCSQQRYLLSSVQMRPIAGRV